ncbi:hypothetical protein BBP40_002055 [Aspergillus hancockii]|nr:hypothetical protein BBP40_002055 [Aspergillus hancockii]
MPPPPANPLRPSRRLKPTRSHASHPKDARSKVTRSRISHTQPWPSPSRAELRVVIPVQTPAKKNKNNEKNKDDDVVDDDEASGPRETPVVVITSVDPVDLGQQSQKENGQGNEQQEEDDSEHESETDQGNGESAQEEDSLLPDHSLPIEVRMKQACNAHATGQYPIKLLSRRFGLPYTHLYSRIKGTRQSKREAQAPRQKLDVSDEVSIGKEALRRIEEEGRRPIQKLLIEVGNDLYKQKCAHLGVDFKPLGQQWPARFLARQPEFKKTWSQLVEVRRPLDRPLRPEVSLDPHPWRFTNEFTAIPEDDFMGFDTPKTEEDCAAYFRQIRSGPPLASARAQKYLTHLLLEQAKSVSMLDRVRKALEEPGKIIEGASVPETREQEQEPLIPANNVSAPSTEEQPSRNTADIMPTINNIFSPHDTPTPMLPSIATTQAPGTKSVAQPQDPQEARPPRETASFTPVMSNASTNHTPRNPQPSITSFQHSSKNCLPQPPQPPQPQTRQEHQGHQELQGLQGVQKPLQSPNTAKTTPKIGDTVSNVATALLATFQRPRAQYAPRLSLPAQPQMHQEYQERQGSQNNASSTPMISTAPTNYTPAPSQTPNTSRHSPSTNYLPQQQQHQQYQERHEPQRAANITNTTTMANSTLSKYPPLPYESSLTSFQLNVSSHKPPPQVRPKAPKASKPQQPRKPRQPAQPSGPSQASHNSHSSHDSNTSQPLQTPQTSRSSRMHTSSPSQTSQAQRSPPPAQTLQLHQLTQALEPPQSLEPPSSSSNIMAANKLAQLAQWGTETLEMASPTPHQSGSFTATIPSAQSTQNQYYPNDYLVGSPMDQPSKRRRIDDPIHLMNHLGSQ